MADIQLDELFIEPCEFCGGFHATEEEIEECDRAIEKGMDE